MDRAKQERGYFVTEYCQNAVDGEEWIKKHGNLDINSGIAVGLQIAKALQLAHKKGIFHLDLKPANLLLSPSENAPSVKVIDFGLAKVAKSLQQELSLKQSKTGLSVLAQSVFGTFDYAPPEQQGYGGEPNAKSDVYAFGKTLYRLLTGEIPHTLHPRRLAKAPGLFELLCDCVEREAEKRSDVEILIKKIGALSSQVHSQPTMDNKNWWYQLDRNWKNIFKDIIDINTRPSKSDFVDIFQLQKVTISVFDNYGERINLEVHDLEPLRQLTNLRELDCSDNLISDLEPLRAKLQKLVCWGNSGISQAEIDEFKKAVPNCKVN